MCDMGISADTAKLLRFLFASLEQVTKFREFFFCEIRREEFVLQILRNKSMYAISFYLFFCKTSCFNFFLYN